MWGKPHLQLLLSGHLISRFPEVRFHRTKNIQTHFSYLKIECGKNMSILGKNNRFYHLISPTSPKLHRKCYKITLQSYNEKYK